MSSLFFSLLSILFLSLPLLSLSSDSDVLLKKIKPALQGNTTIANTQLSTWNLSTPLCQWRGLQWATATGAALSCDSASTRSNLSLNSDTSIQLTSIQLPASGLQGYIPSEIGDFSYLQSIYLAVNSLHGSIPLELGNSPSLLRIDLGSNSFNGSLPPSIWNLCDQLVSVRFHGNRLSGSLPNPAGANQTCDSLKILDFGENKLEGGFPLFITKFSGLQELDLSANRFTGSVPEALAEMKSLQKLNISSNNFTGMLPAEFANSKFGADSFEGNSASLCGSPLDKCGSGSGSGLSPGLIAGIVIGLMAGGVVLASVLIGLFQRKKNKNKGIEVEELEIEDGEQNGEGKLLVFQGGEHLTLEEVLNATGQVMEKSSYGTVYKAKLSDGGNIALRLLREGSCKDPEECIPLVREFAHARHENLVPLRAFYQGMRGEKLLICDYFPHKSLFDILHESTTGRTLLNWPKRHKIALGVARGLSHLHTGHDTPIIHGDVRSKHVLIDELFIPKLTDYGIGQLMISAVADELLSASSADGYKAPELNKMKRCNARTDIYSFGILLLELLMGKKPGDAKNGGFDLPALVKVAVLEETTMEIFDPEILKGIRNPTEDGLVQALKLAMGCCAPVAPVRPDMAEVVRQLEDNRPRNRSNLYSPADIRSGAATPY
ncbi:putative kinase-like protein TMKL1 [Carex littledalei]|uniref:Putative kinase-like protein TMKL1 n=1 Tax=Carex littledalei TaxID=544730 RepID=A0A833QVJ2_9POAL|nr:putative kinase-like protein TMKL1 [Carex littledalei]